MKLVITIDTEEDNWLPFSPKVTTENAAEIARVHDLFLSEQVLPTYLVTWPMAHNDTLIRTLADENRAGRCEIGMHCHPWTTPPHEETHRAENSMLCNLPPALAAAKMEALHALLVERFGTVPRTFRAGRWGYGPQVAEVLLRLGYRVDTSITAFTDWSAQCGPDYSLVGPQPYRFTPPAIYTATPDGPLVELPATAGFLADDYARSARFERLARRAPLRWFRLLGIFERLSIHNRITLSPECASAREMQALLDAMQALGFGYVNLFFHSPTLVPGLTPYVKTKRDLASFLHSLRSVLRHARSHGITPILARDALATGTASSVAAPTTARPAAGSG